MGYWDATKWTDAPGQKNGPFAQLRSLYEQAVDAAEPVKAKRADLAGSGRYTPSGIAELIRQTARDNVLALRKVRAEGLARFRREIDNRRARMKPFEHDPQDVVAALDRQEVRTVLRGMPEGERTKVLRRAADPEYFDRELIEAAISAPSLISGISDSLRDDLGQQLIRDRHGEELEALEVLEEAVETTERAFDAARAEIAEETGMLPHEFDAEVKPEEERIDREAARTKGGVVDVESVAETIKAMGYGDRSKLIDLALERQTDELRERHGKPAEEAA